MRFTLATVALLAGAVMAQETVYQTDVETVISCAATVTNCPARKHSSTAVPAAVSAPSPVSAVSVSSAPAVAPAPAPVVSSAAPAPAAPSVSSAVSPVSVAPAPSAPSPAGSAAPAPAPAQSSPSVSTSVIAVTTCVPTTIYSTITYTPAPSSVAPVVAPNNQVGTAAPLGTGSPVPGSSTHPSAPLYTGAANTVSGSFLMAGAAAVAAVLLA